MASVYEYRIIQAGPEGHYYAQWKTSGWELWLDIAGGKPTEARSRAHIASFKADVIARQQRETPTRIIKVD